MLFNFSVLLNVWRAFTVDTLTSADYWVGGFYCEVGPLYLFLVLKRLRASSRLNLN